MTILMSLIMATTLNSMVLFDFTENRNTGNWMVVNDGVMGGLSNGTFTAGGNGSAVFKGTISLENNGGFSSVQCNTGKIDVEGFTTLDVYLKGDGKTYQVRIQENGSDYFSYIFTFQTSGAWETVKIPLAEMYPSFRGRKLNLPNFSGKSMVELTFLIGNSKAESFHLELRKAELKQGA
jgi:NADH dehydrogenase [ubiquinone] 1 alpha subcomplex assembly factor 1